MPSSHSHHEPTNQEPAAKVEEKKPDQDQEMGAREDFQPDRAQKEKPQMNNNGDV